MSVPRMAKAWGRWQLGAAAATAAALAGPAVALADSKKKDDSGAPYFDPDALERGAKALREINASPHAKQVGRGAAPGIAPGGQACQASLGAAAAPADASRRSGTA